MLPRTWRSSSRILSYLPAISLNRKVTKQQRQAPFSSTNLIDIQHVSQANPFYSSAGAYQVPIKQIQMASVDQVLAGKYPAKAHARRVTEYIKRTKPDAQGVLYLEGQKTKLIEDNDETVLFR
jgi:hypothetical protein